MHRLLLLHEALIRMRFPTILADGYNKLHLLCLWSLSNTTAEDYRVFAIDTMLSPSMTSLNISVAIVDDSVLENQEMFHLDAIGNEQMFRTDVTINDNDGESNLVLPYKS